MKVYGDKVRVAWKHNPLSIHPDAPLAHLASVAAGEQGRFWEYHDKIFANQKKIKKDSLLQYARELDLDMARFQQAIETSRGKEKIEADMAEAQSLGATGTPAFFINGRYLSGAQPFEGFAKVINGELRRLGLPVPPEGAAAGG